MSSSKLSFVAKVVVIAAIGLLFASIFLAKWSDVVSAWKLEGQQRAVLEKFLTNDVTVGNSVSHINPCVINLQLMVLAKQKWADANHATNGEPVTMAQLTNFIPVSLMRKFPLKCPSGGIYTIGKIGEPPTCSLGKTNSLHALP